MTLLGGYLTDRVGKKPVLITGIALSAVANACYLHYLSYLGQAVVGVVSGFGAGMMTVVLPIIVSEAVDASARGAAMGAYRTVFDIGSVTGPIVATMGLANIEDLEVGSVQLRFYVFAAVLAIGIPLVLTLRGPSRAADDLARASK
jgi:MFS family permease